MTQVVDDKQKPFAQAQLAGGQAMRAFANLPWHILGIICAASIGLAISRDELALGSVNRTGVQWRWPKVSVDAKLIAIANCVWVWSEEHQRPTFSKPELVVFSTTTGLPVFQALLDDLRPAKFPFSYDFDPINPHVLVYGPKDRKLWAVDLRNKTETVVLESCPSPLLDVTFCPNGKYVALMHWVKNAQGADVYYVRVLEYASRRVVQALSDIAANCLTRPAWAFSQDSRLFALTEYDQIFVYDLAQGKKWKLQLEGSNGDADYDYISMAFSPTTEIVYAVNRKGMVHTWHVKHGQMLGTIKISPPGPFVCVRAIQPAGGPPILVIYDYDCKHALSLSGDNWQRIWSRELCESAADEGERCCELAIPQNSGTGFLLMQTPSQMHLRRINLQNGKLDDKVVILRQ